MHKYDIIFHYHRPENEDRGGYVDPLPLPSKRKNLMHGYSRNSRVTFVLKILRLRVCNFSRVTFVLEKLGARVRKIFSRYFQSKKTECTGKGDFLLYQQMEK